MNDSLSKQVAYALEVRTQIGFVGGVITIWLLSWFAPLWAVCLGGVLAGLTRILWEYYKLRKL